MPYHLGLDISTTATKALLVDERGTVAGTAAYGYDFDTPFPLWSEQEPACWWEGTMESIRHLLAETGIAPDDIVGVGLTGQMHGLVLLDEDGHVIRPAILWNDQRTAAECDLIRQRLGRERLLEVTGNDALTGFTAPKLLWVQEHEPEYYERIRHVLLPKDYVRYRLTGTFATDKAGAAGTLLMDLQARDWSEEVLGGLGVRREWLPPTHEGPEITGRISAKGAEATGLREGTPVVAGAGDQAAQAVGVGAVRKGIVAVTLGTSGVVFAATDAPTIDRQGRVHSFCHAVPGQWHLMGVMLSAAGSLRWYRDTVAPDESFGELVEAAGDLPLGSQGLLFLPYLTGERTPHADPHARGAFVGLTVRHERHHLTRAVLEGVAFGLRDIFRVLEEAGLHEPAEVRISGGGAGSPVWRQIVADVLGLDLVATRSHEGAALGAALLAGVGAGTWGSVEEATDAAVETTGTTEADLDCTHEYGAYYRRYRELYDVLRPTFEKLSQLETAQEEGVR